MRVNYSNGKAQIIVKYGEKRLLRRISNTKRMTKDQIKRTITGVL